ncbi:pilus assembly protein PilZ [Pokkaliibacter plantistimulans]|uniref:Pilus assembly protein PilZ n=2 Tax=Pseudomonadota TaxID=1224 RepID=A0ABX5M2T6_9GAMM|nr:PilZ domain-containing protein [Pokkaliibacter plantistimulans]PPC79391.1 pilus assembly protein PilZ [Pokkaliibacter plantistimulans]PXF33222.1 pilus assembly protein PilZ [Pokkaliibacter plantistimulans]
MAHGILNCTFDSKTMLYQCYMPFIERGGLFIPTQRTYQLGDEVFAVLTIMNEPEKVPVSGKVIWITPPGGQNNRPAGVGIQVNPQDEAAIRKLETLLAGTQESDTTTFTM